MSLTGRATMTRDVSAPPSFRAFYDRNVQNVIALGIALTGDRPAAEDVAQEAFLRAYRDWERISGYDDPAAWVRRVTSNLAASRWRRLARERRALLRLGKRDEPEPPPMEPPDDRFWKAVRSLPHRQAQAVALHYVDELSIDEIAETLGTSYSATKSLLHRGRERLAPILAEEEYR